MSTARARESDPLLRRTVTGRARGLGVASMIALGVGACAVVVVAGFGNARGGAVGTAAPSTTLRARLGAATSAKTRATMIEAKKAEMEKMAREIDDAAARALRKAKFESDDLAAAERDVGDEDETCPSTQAKTQTAYAKRIKKVLDKEKVAVKKRKKIDDELRASKGKPNRMKRKGRRGNETAALGGLDWIGNVVDAAGTMTSWSSEIIGEFAEEVDEGSGFCWRESYTREGILPQYCGDDGKKEIVGEGGLICYDKCSNFGEGYYRSGYDCYQSCSTGWNDHGMLCNNPDASYGRGVGTIECDWDWSTFSVKCGGDLCTKKGKEDYLGLCYDKCKSGYSNFGSNICTMDCQKQGYEGGVAPSCTKYVHLSPGYEWATCPPGYEYDAGLCYEPCKEGFVGAAFVCWGDPPTVNGVRWVECGMGAAADDATCALVITDQIMGPLEMVAFFATLGASSGATTGAKIGVKTATKCAKAADKIGDTAKAVKKTAEELKDAYDNIDDAISTADGIVGGIEDMMSVETEADGIRAAAEVAALFDPTGISSTVAAYSHDICTRYTESQAEADAADPELLEAQKVAVARAMTLWSQGKTVERCGRAVTWQMKNQGRSDAEAEELREQVEAALNAASSSSDANTFVEKLTDATENIPNV